jgi:hypothetical protein
VASWAAAATAFATLLLAGVPFCFPSVEARVLELVEAMTWDLAKTPSSARIVSSIVYRSEQRGCYVCLVEIDGHDVGSMPRSHLAFFVRSDVPQLPNVGYRTPDRVRDQCRTSEGTLWIQCIEKFDSRPDRRTLCASRELSDLGLHFGNDDRGWSIE